MGQDLAPVTIKQSVDSILAKVRQIDAHTGDSND